MLLLSKGRSALCHFFPSTLGSKIKKMIMLKGQKLESSVSGILCGLRILNKYLMDNYVTKCLSFFLSLFVRFISGDDLQPALVVSGICLIPLILMRAVRNLVAPPIVIITDSKEFAFNFPTRYRIDVSKLRHL